jgi:cytoskeletal protein CcmA (bactofilin family)
MSFWNKMENRSGEPADATPARAEPARAEPPPAAAAPAPTAERAAERIAERAPERAPARQEPARPAPGDLRLGRGVRLEGKLTFSGTVRIDATFQGSIITDGVLVVGEHAKVDAKINCGTVIVEGEVNGDVTASSGVELHASGRLRGDVESPEFAIDRGAVFEGSSRRPGSGSARAGKAAAAPAS